MADWTAKTFQALAYLSMATFYIIKTVKEVKRRKPKGKRKKG
jgi:hypothetical protein